MELISQAKYARRLGIAPSTLHRYIRKGAITLIDGKVDPEQADRDLALTSHRGRKKLRFEVDAAYSWPGGDWPT